MKENIFSKLDKKAYIITLIVLIALVIGVIVIFNKNNGNSLKGGDYIYNNQIDSIVIQYYEGYNFVTGELLSDSVPLCTIEIDSTNLPEVSEIIHKLKKIEFKNEDEMNRQLKYDYLSDCYKLKINDNLSLFIGDEYGMIEDSEDYFKVPKELFDKVTELVRNNNEVNNQSKINSDKFTIIYEDNAIEITDSKQIQELSNRDYYVLNAEENTYMLQEEKYKLELNDDREIYIYDNSVISRIYYANGSTDYIFTGDLVDYIESIVNNLYI